MDEEMSFPNPVMRTDLPVKKRHWKRYVAAALVLSLLSVVFMPQILHNRIGRRLLRAKLEAKYNAEIAIQDITTSWRGGTTVTQFWIKGNDGRVIGFSSLKSDVSLWKLLRGQYDLGKCDIDGLVVEWVFDSGDDAHRDTYERLTGALPWKPGMPPSPLAHVSGDITITNGQISLYRGETDPRTLNTTYQTVRCTAVTGSFRIPTSLDKPWKYELDGNIGLTGDERNQTFETSGTLSLGENGALVASGIQVDATAKAVNVPTDIVGVLLPLLSPKDYKSAFGSTFDRVNVALHGTNGVLTLDVTELASPSAQVRIKPTFDLKTFPTTVTIANGAENTIIAALPNGPARRGLAVVNPFVLQATKGTVVLRLKALDVPLVRQWWVGTGKAQLEFQDLKLTDTRELLGNSYPRSLAGQLGLISGEINATPAIQSPPIDFAIENGTVTVSPTTMQIGAAHVTLKGTATVEGDLKMTLGVTSPSLQAEVPELAKGTSVQVPLIGTVDKPTLQLDAAIAALPPDPAAKLRAWVDKQLATLRTRDQEAAQREKERQVQEMLKTYQEKKGQ